MFGAYNKSVTALVGAVIGFASVVVTSDPSAITSSEWLGGAIGLATALGVFVAPKNATG